MLCALAERSPGIGSDDKTDSVLRPAFLRGQSSTHKYQEANCPKCRRASSMPALLVQPQQQQQQ